MTDGFPTPTWQERIGGRWAISLPAYAIGVALNVPLLAFTGGEIGAQQVRLDQVGPWFALGLLAALMTGAWAYAMHRTVFRNRAVRPVPPWLAIGFHAVVGLIFGLLVVLGGNAWIESNPQPPVGRIVVIMCIGIWFGLTMSLLLEARDRFARERRALIEDAVQLELASLNESEAAARLRTTLNTEVGDALDGLRTDVDTVMQGIESTTLLDVDEWWRISKEMRSTADATVRPLSKQLWEATEASYPSPTIRQVVVRMLRSQRFAPLPTFIIMGIGYLGASTYRFGFWLGLLAAAAMAAGVAVILLAANALMGRAPRAHAAIVIGAFIVAQLYAIGYVLLLSSVGPATDLGPELLGSVIGTGISVLAPAVVASLNANRAAVLAQFRDEAEGVRISQLAQSRQLAALTRDAARHLHGTVQTRLIACAGAIEQASRAGDVAQFREALRMSVAILEAPVFDDSDGAGRTVAQEVELRCSPWQGLCAFDIAIHPALADERGDLATALGKVIEEGIANACRHGLATAIAIAIEPAGGDVEVTITDNGTGPGAGEPGLGTTILTRVSAGRVRLERAPVGKGAQLQVLIAR